jgi:hypothetical protein
MMFPLSTKLTVKVSLVRMLSDVFCPATGDVLISVGTNKVSLLLI